MDIHGYSCYSTSIRKNLWVFEAFFTNKEMEGYSCFGKEGQVVLFVVYYSADFIE